MKVISIRHMFSLLIYFLLTPSLLGCDKKEVAGDKEDIEIDIPNADSLLAHSGNQRMEISWIPSADNQASTYEVIWYSQGDRGSIRNSIPRADNDKRVRVLLDEMKEGNYLVDLYLYDEEGNVSPKSSTGATVYGPEYQSGIEQNSFKDSRVLKNGIELSWSISRQDLLRTEVRYTDSEGNAVVHFVSGTSTLDTLKGTNSTQAFEYRSAYLPDATSIDTFYTDYQTAQVGLGYAYQLKYDEASETAYYLSKIHHRDPAGQLIKLKLAHTVKEEGETVRQFAERTNSKLAFNASTQVKFEDNKMKNNVPSTVAIIDGKIINNEPRDNRLTLGIKDNNELFVFEPGTTAETILATGTKNAVTAFVPLILDYERAPDKILSYVGNLAVKHPRQVIAQLENLDIVFLTTGGRGFGGKGMTGEELIRILKDLNVKFAYNLDGGGSTSLVVDEKFINWKIDKNGTQERKRPTFLYVE